jgi:hypothetical protein
VSVAVDDFVTFETGLQSPMVHAAIVTPSDSVDLSDVTRGITLSVAADVKVTTAGGETVVIPSGSLAAGVIHPLRVSRVWATGTGSTTVVAYW